MTKDELMLEQWPELPYEAFKSTAHLLHMGMQAIGKLKLTTPFEPHWANVPLWLSTRGVTTGLISYGQGGFGVNVDLQTHGISCTTTWGNIEKFEITSTSVAELTEKLFSLLKKCGVDIEVNPMPQEIPNPIPFNQDTEKRHYDTALANAWWRILISSYRVIKRYHARFKGITPPVGLMWGTFDLRDARYRNIPVPTTGPNAGYIRRNAMDVVQVEIGFWHGNPQYMKPAYFSFIYPQPEGIENAKIKPKEGRFEPSLGEFILDYDDVRKSQDPEKSLLDFFESTYHIEAEKAGWEAKLIGSGEPV